MAKKQITEPAKPSKLDEIETASLRQLKKALGDAAAYYTKLEKTYTQELKDYAKENRKTVRTVERTFRMHMDMTPPVEEIVSAIKSLLDSISKHVRVTQDYELEEAVRSFYNDLKNVNPPEFSRVLPRIIEYCKTAEAHVPMVLGPKGRRDLEDCFGTLRHLFFYLGNIDIKDPKIPQAMLPEDPNQLQLKFASRVVSKYLQSRRH